MLKLETLSDLQSLIDDEISESLTLDYKASPSLGKDSKQRDELCKDVSAFANSAGGQIIYGIEEKDHKPLKIDAGSSVPREWIEQVVDSNIQPRIEGLVITPIPPESVQNVYVVTIPQASSRAPHQAPDKKYYKRQNFQSIPMEDYEIRDTLRRQTTPNLAITLGLPLGNNGRLELVHGQEVSKPIALKVFVSNLSPQPAFHTLVRVGVQREVNILNTGDFAGTGQTESDGLKLSQFTRRLSTPPDLPIFQEIGQDLGSLHLGFHNRMMGGPPLYKFRVITNVLTPGFSKTEYWSLALQGFYLELIKHGERLPE